MSQAAHRVHYTFLDYVALQATSTVKLEYLDGQIYAMAGGTPEHAALGAAVIGLLFAQLRGGTCRIFDSDLSIRVGATGLATYPDVTVVCGPREHAAEGMNAVTNPTLLVEVTSRSTEEYDRGEKFDHYRQIPSLAEYLLVSHQERVIEVRRRVGDVWETEIARAGQRVELQSVACVLEVDALYDAASEVPAL